MFLINRFRIAATVIHLLFFGSVLSLHHYFETQINGLLGYSETNLSAEQSRLREQFLQPFTEYEIAWVADGSPRYLLPQRLWGRNLWQEQPPYPRLSQHQEQQIMDARLVPHPLDQLAYISVADLRSLFGIARFFLFAGILASLASGEFFRRLTLPLEAKYLSLVALCVAFRLLVMPNIVPHVAGPSSMVIFTVSVFLTALAFDTTSWFSRNGK